MQRMGSLAAWGGGALALTLAFSGSAAAQSYDYVVVGSGAGGGPLAVRLAERGYSVLLLEAGELAVQDEPVVEVPVFHAAASEHPGTSWEFFVEHYRDGVRAGRDPKRCDGQAGDTGDADPQNDACEAGEQGVFYPRGSTVGGSTSVNAMISVLPHASDWEHMAEVTGDSTWLPSMMGLYQRRIERNVRKASGSEGYSTDDGHDTEGWLAIDDRGFLRVDVENVDDTFLDPGAPIQQDYVDLLMAVNGHARQAGFFDEKFGELLGFALGDVNRQRFESGVTPAVSTRLKAGNGGYQAPFEDNYVGEPLGNYTVPVAVDENGRRSGVRTRILAALDDPSANLTLRTGAFVTKVNFDTSGYAPRATGVTYRSGSKLYEASHAQNTSNSGTDTTVVATREVIVSAGAFNTPQLLMLSGVGPAAELSKLSGVAPIATLEGVGQNLQDRYEVPVIAQRTVDEPGNVSKPFLALSPTRDGDPLQCGFDPANLSTDDCYDDWSSVGRGSYSQPGAVFSTIKYSGDLTLSGAFDPTTDYYTADPTPDPDLYVFGLSAAFEGYFPRYSDRLFDDEDRFTWLVLKGHSHNRGSVTLRSDDPFDAPEINFDYFGNPPAGQMPVAEHKEDLDAVVKGVQQALGDISAYNSMQAQRGDPEGFMQVVMPDAVQRGSDQALANYVMDHAWGHHASCTAKMGAADDAMAVVDHRFRVYGTLGLRVVDASVFPRIPGFFPALSIYMMSEKAADLILLEDFASPGGILRAERGGAMADDELLVDWKPRPGTSFYALWLGSSPGATDLGVHSFGADVKHARISGLPTTGPVYARLYSFVPQPGGSASTPYVSATITAP